MPYYYFDPTMILLIPGIILAMYAEFKVKSTFSTYEKVSSYKRIPGHEVARMLLKAEGISDVTVEHISGNLTDHYDPQAKVLRLSDKVYNSSSIAAAGVAAHETGHAIQHAHGYVPLTMRSAIFPAARFGSNLSMPLILAGILFSTNILIQLGILLFSAAVVFQLVTLPVEFNASSRATDLLEINGILTHEENSYAKKVLNAAALTYVASAISSMLSLLRLILISRRSN